MHMHKVSTTQVSYSRGGGEGLKLHFLCKWGEGMRIKESEHTGILAYKMVVLSQSWKMTETISATAMTSKGRNPTLTEQTGPRSLLLITQVAELSLA